MKKFIKYFTVLIMTLVSLSATVAAANKYGVFEETQNQVSVKLVTDKTSYKEGEAISYALVVENNRETWNVYSIEVKDSFDKEFSYVEGSVNTCDNSIVAGDAYVMNGAISKTGTGEIVEINLDKVDFSETGDVDNNSEEKSSDKMLLSSVLIICGVIFIALAVINVVVSKKRKNKKALSFFLALAVAASVFCSDALQAGAATSGADEFTVRPYVNVDYAGEEVMVRFVVNIVMSQPRQTIDTADRDTANHICCHDPSIFKDKDGKYYVFGSFLATGYSDNLNDWTSNDAGFQATFTQETKDLIRSWNKDEKAGSWNSYLWAPDVIYNTSMNKYCMYLSANGDDWKSNIVLLTADSVYGPYDYAGTIVYGGFDAETIGETDALQVLNVDKIPDSYVLYGVKDKKWGDKYPNCIDPCVFYDEEGNLWMSYGSWSGGIFMLALDEETGLRDYSVTYETNAHSDAYFGTKIAGGEYVSGEASYIQHIGDYYYLFVSYGNLEAKGGYNIRVFRSERPDGDYVDELGNSAFYDTYQFNYNHSVGVRLFGGYKWRTMSKGEGAQGHNSAFVDDDGKAYIVFHTRTNDGSEGHYVKVHQLFVNKEGWLVAAPYVTNGEARNENGFSMKDVAGKYELIIHNYDIDFQHLEVMMSDVVSLNEDGTITGTYNGSWSVDENTDYITIELEGTTYSGVTLQMKIENSTIDTQVFTALGIDNQVSIWGSRIIE